MNIFVPFPDCDESAEFLDSKRVVQMIKESTKILSDVCRLKGFEAPYEMINNGTHPCVLWAASSGNNYEWLLRYLNSLNRVYNKRYNNGNHRSWLVCRNLLDENNGRMSCIGSTPFVNNAKDEKRGIDFTGVEDVHEAYRMFLQTMWSMDKPKPTWVGPGRTAYRDLINETEDEPSEDERERRDMFTPEIRSAPLESRAHYGGHRVNVSYGVQLSAVPQGITQESVIPPVRQWVGSTLTVPTAADIASVTVTTDVGGYASSSLDNLLEQARRTSTIGRRGGRSRR